MAFILPEACFPFVTKYPATAPTIPAIESTAKTISVVLIDWRRDATDFLDGRLVRFRSFDFALILLSRVLVRLLLEYLDELNKEEIKSDAALIGFLLSFFLLFFEFGVDA